MYDSPAFPMAAFFGTNRDLVKAEAEAKKEELATENSNLYEVREVLIVEEVG
jgi:hypothetical protein